MTTLMENDIRPRQLMDRQRVMSGIDAGRIKYDEVVFVACPACGSSRSTPKFVKNRIQYIDCMDCRTFDVNPRASSAVLDWFYEGSTNHAYWNDVIFPASEKARREKIFIPPVRQINDICAKDGVEGGSLLEVGAGVLVDGSEQLRKAFQGFLVQHGLTSNMWTVAKKRANHA